MRIIQVWVNEGPVPDYWYSNVTKIKWTRSWLEIEFKGGNAKIMKRAILAFKDSMSSENFPSEPE